MLAKGIPTYEYLGILALALRGQNLTMTTDALQAQLASLGAVYTHPQHRDLGRVLKAAYHHWLRKREETALAVSYAYVGRHGHYLA